MNLRKLYQWVGINSKHWTGVSRQYRENVQVFSRAVVLIQGSQVRKLAGTSPRLMRGGYGVGTELSMSGDQTEQNRVAQRRSGVF